MSDTSNFGQGTVDSFPAVSGTTPMNQSPLTHSQRHTLEESGEVAVETALTTVLSVTASATATAWGHHNVSAAAGSVTLTLPTGVGKVWVSATRVDSSANTVTVACGAGQTFADGSTSIVLSGQNVGGKWHYDGSSKWTVEGAQPGANVPSAALALFYVDSYGQGTDDANLLAAISAWGASSGGGVIALGARKYTITSQTVITAVASALHGGGLPTQKPCILQGAVVSKNSWGDTPTDGTIIDHQYNGGQPGKIYASGTGYFEVCNITFTDSTGGSTAFILDTNTTPNIHDNNFCGSKVGTACNQDAIWLGGTGDTRTGAPTDAFAGYGGGIYRNQFSGIRECVRWGAGANNIPAWNNEITGTCGAPSGSYAPFHLIGQTNYGADGNPIWANTIEMTNYVYGIICDANTGGNDLAGNGFYDAGANTIACVRFTGGSGQNLLRGAVYNPATTLLFVEDNSSAGTNYVDDPQQAGVTQRPVNAMRRYLGNAFFSNAAKGPIALAPTGEQAYLKIIASASGTPEVIVATVPGTATSDFTLVSGSPYALSATAAFTSSDIQAAIGCSTISSPAFINAVYTTTTAPAWTATTAHAAGDIVRPTTANGHMYQCTTAGTTGAAEPVWPTTGGTVTDGTAVWTDRGAVTAALMNRNATATGTNVIVTWQRPGAEQQQIGFQRNHIVTQGGTPSIAADAGLAGGSVAWSGTDTAGELTLVSGPTPPAGAAQMCHWVFAAAFPSPKYSICPKNAAAAALMSQVYIDSSNRMQYTGTQLPASTTFIFDLVILQ